MHVFEFESHDPDLNDPFPQESFVNMENMLDLLDEEPEVSDEPGAPDLLAATGKIEFKNVSFGYSAERTILKDLSFTAMPGQTVAFVSTKCIRYDNGR